MEIAGYYEGRGATWLATDVLDRLQRALEEGEVGRAACRQPPETWGERDGASTGWDSFGDSEG